MSKYDESNKQFDFIDKSSNNWLKNAVNDDNTISISIVKKEEIAIGYHNQSIELDKDSTCTFFSPSSIISSKQQAGFNSTQDVPKITDIKMKRSATYLYCFNRHQGIEQGVNQKKGNQEKEEKEKEEMEKNQLQNKRNATLFLLPLSSTSQQQNYSIDNENDFILNQNSTNSILTSSLYSTFTNDSYHQQQVSLSNNINNDHMKYSLSNHQSESNDDDYYSISPISSSLSPLPSPQSLKNQTNRSATTLLLDDQSYSITNLSSSSPFFSLSDLAAAEKIANDIWNKTQIFCKHEDITIWLGKNDPFRKHILHFYMNHFNFTGQRLDEAFRDVANKLYLKAEAQQLDRVVEAFAKRFWECNPNDELYYNADIVYVITYSLLLLNTDLYNTNHYKKMNQSQFTKNTMETIIPLLRSNNYDDNDLLTTYPYTAFENTSVLKPDFKKQTGLPSLTSSQTFTCLYDTAKAKNQLDKSQSLMDLNTYQQQQNEEKKSPFLKDQKKWIIQMESLLKLMYKSIKENEIGLCATIHPSDNTENKLTPKDSKYILNIKMENEYKKKPIKRGKSITSLSTPILSNHLKSKKKRWIPKLKNNKTAVTLATSSLKNDYIKIHPTISMKDDSNQHLLFKEGWVMRKYLMKDHQQKSKKQNYWKLCYITLLNGQLFIQSTLSSFSNRYCWGKTHRPSSFISSPHLNLKYYWSDRKKWKLDYSRKSKLLEYDYHDKELKSLGKKERIDLKHSLTHILSGGGGGKRKHVLSLKLADGSSLLFEVSSIKKAREWEFIMNYWAGLQSKIPLEGSVTNLNYFGNHNNKIGDIMKNDHPLTIGSPSSSTSLLLSSCSIPTWEYPIATMIQSQKSLDDQLIAIDNHIQSLHDQLNQHQDLIKEIENNYSKSCIDKKKVINNWETKMQYLIYENIKFKTYYEVLSST